MFAYVKKYMKDKKSTAFEKLCKISEGPKEKHCISFSFIVK